MSQPAFVVGKNDKALFTLKVHRGERMCLLAMNWKKGKPTNDFVGFAIQYKEPDKDQFFTVHNRITFPGVDPNSSPQAKLSWNSPIQKFRWVHFPNDAHIEGKFVYRVTPVFMNAQGDLAHGEHQQVEIDLASETHPGQMSVNFTRGFIASQAFTDRFASGPSGTKGILPDGKAGDEAITYRPKAKNANDALSWMGFDGRKASFDLLDKAIADKDAQVCMVAYDLDSPEIMDRIKQLGDRIRVIIDNDPNSAHAPGKKKPEPTDEDKAEKMIKASAGKDHVKRQHMGSIQHNKMLVVQSPKFQSAICGSTNFSWRGYYVQNNHVVIVHGKSAVAPFAAAFEQYWKSDSPNDFQATSCVEWNPLKLKGIDAQVTFSPHGKAHSVYEQLASDIRTAKSNVLYSIAFLGASPGHIHDALVDLTKEGKIFVYGITDKPMKIGGQSSVILQTADGNLSPVSPANLSKNVPEPFKSEPSGAGGARMHHKFIVIDFGTPQARVYFGSHNMSHGADVSNGENLMFVKDSRVATSFAIEALRIFDHYEFRVAAAANKGKAKAINLVPPPAKGSKDLPWWDKDYTVDHRIRDRKLFS